MNIPIQGNDIVIASVLSVMLVMPTIFHLVADLRTRPTRNFSLIPHKKRHLFATVVRLALIAGAAIISTGVADPSTSRNIWGGLAVALFVLNGLGATDRRLTINAQSGLVRWRKFSLPWWPKDRGSTGFIDKVSKVRFESSIKMMNLLGVGELAQIWRVNYNGSVSTSGFYSERTLKWVAKEVNNYLAAFKRHDTDAAREARDSFRASYRAARAPGRKAARDRAGRSRNAAAEKQQQREAKRRARETERERERIARVDEKFKQ